MVLTVVLVAIPPALWTWRIVTDETRFVAAVSSLPRHPLVGRAVSRRTPAPIARLVARTVGTRPARYLWRRGSIVAHRRSRRITHRAALALTAAFATLGTQHGRWRALAWFIGSITLASTLRTIF
jgi:hypothetical protein